MLQSRKLATEHQYSKNTSSKAQWKATYRIKSLQTKQRHHTARITLQQLYRSVRSKKTWKPWLERRKYLLCVRPPLKKRKNMVKSILRRSKKRYRQENLGERSE